MIDRGFVIARYGDTLNSKIEETSAHLGKYFSHKNHGTIRLPTRPDTADCKFIDDSSSI